MSLTPSAVATAASRRAASGGNSIAYISLTNFKAFGERVTFHFRPITLLYGENSSGKSSLTQSLLLLKQSLAQSPHDYPGLAPRGPLVNLGSYRELVYRHDTARSLE